MFSITTEKMLSINSLLSSFNDEPHENKVLNSSGCWGCGGGCTATCARGCKSWSSSSFNGK